MKTKIIVCDIMREEILAIVKAEDSLDLSFVDLGLHKFPQKLHRELQSLLNATSGYSRIVLAFGLCGGALKGLQAPAGAILTIPRVHDCIPLFLGSQEVFEELQKKRGTFYLTCGWVEMEKSILGEHDMNCRKFGEKKAQRILDLMFNSYRCIQFIHTGHPREEAGLSKSRNTAELLKVSHQTFQGSPRYLEKLIRGPWDDEEFINVLPGGHIDESDFTPR
ncbi:DUF1638 domain-containing protein [Heliobacterium chlorum]|uniref:DUF1638 domain-containing protein n=1 Tax=Heliobacterium chlorum TaxID=2698 RepID=A0ABR7T0R3_HELCL|nr:DUF1638 domain-containing protein [Heliobacterium chlorum]MBC9784378.1 DUF1638 domain-containing protein [Heliobacterium chlorum]